MTKEHIILGVVLFAAAAGVFISKPQTIQVSHPPIMGATQQVYEVRPSEIHGKGLFATTMMGKHTRIYIPGTIVPQHDCDQYCVDFDGYTLRPHEPFMFLNHSKTPNCELVIDEDGLWVQPIEFVRPGAELTIDYGYKP